MYIDELKVKIKLFQIKIQNNQFSKINLDILKYEELVLLFHKYYENEEICKKIVSNSRFDKFIKKEKQTALYSLQLFEILNKILSQDEEFNENDVYKIYEILSKPLKGLDIISLKIFTDEIIKLCLKNDDIESIKELIYDLISKYFSLDVLSKSMIKFYIIDAVLEDGLDDVVKEIKFKNEGGLAYFYLKKKLINIAYNTLNDYFKKNNLSSVTIKNRMLLQVIEHELDHAFMHKIRSSYNVLAPSYKHQIQIKEFNYFINSIKCVDIIKGIHFSLAPFLGDMYLEHRANTFGYLKSIKRIKKKYARFLPKDIYKKLYSETFLNIAYLYSYDDRAPFKIQDEVYYKLYGKQFKDESFKEFIDESYARTKDLFEDLFDEEIDEVTVFELHRIMIGDQTIKDYDLKEFVSAGDGNSFIGNIRNKK